MKFIKELFVELNIETVKDIEDLVENKELDELIIIVDYIENNLESSFIEKEYSPFSFVPSEDLSGVGGCSYTGCKIERAKEFRLFGALYADNIYLMLNYFSSCHFNFKAQLKYITECEWDFRTRIYYDLIIMFEYLELIDEGIAQIIPAPMSLCPDCFQKVLLDLEQPVDLKLIKKSVRQRLKLKISDYNKNGKWVAVQFLNIEEFFPKHSQIRNYDGEFFNLLNDTEIRRSSIIKNEKFIDAVIDEFINEQFSKVCLYSLSCKNLDSKFITDKQSDRIFMEMTHLNNSLKSYIPQISKLPIYELPIANANSLDSIMKLRNIEQDSFDRYRIALNKAFKEQYKTSNKIQMNEIYDDIIYPELINLNNRLHRVKSGVFKKTFSSIFIISSVITAGLYTGIIPKDSIEILKAIGGTSAITSTGMASLNNLIDKKNPIKDNDFYFLWKLKNQM